MLPEVTYVFLIILQIRPAFKLLDDFGRILQIQWELIHDRDVIAQRLYEIIDIKNICKIAASQATRIELISPGDNAEPSSESEGIEIQSMRRELGHIPNQGLVNWSLHESHLESFQNEALSNSGITSVALIRRAIATMSHICTRSQHCLRICYSERYQN